jgi:hypothetical protein
MPDLEHPSGGFTNRTRVKMGEKIGKVDFIRLGFVRVHWDDGSTTLEWGLDLEIVDENE